MFLTPPNVVHFLDHQRTLVAVVDPSIRRTLAAQKRILAGRLRLLFAAVTHKFLNCGVQTPRQTPPDNQTHHQTPRCFVSKSARKLRK